MLDLFAAKISTRADYDRSAKTPASEVGHRDAHSNARTGVAGIAPLKLLDFKSLWRYWRNSSSRFRHQREMDSNNVIVLQDT